MSLDFFDVGKEHAANQGNYSSTEYLTLNDGESKIIRFLTGLSPMKVYNHNCGVQLNDYPVKEWDALRAAGQPVLCPQCGQPIEDTDVQYVRPGVVGANLHRFVQCGDGNRSSFVCLGSVDNGKYGWIPADAEGNPTYQCPICPSQANLNSQGKPKKPSFRLYGVAIERAAEETTEYVNGVPVPKITGIHDVTVTDEDGTVHPKVVLVDMGMKGFWSKVEAAVKGDRKMVSYYDWRVVRTGEKLDTTYDIVQVPDSIKAVDMRKYEQFMPEISEMLKRLGDPSYYVKKGWGVQGYVPPQDDGQQGAPAQQQPQQPAVTPVINAGAAQIPGATQTPAGTQPAAPAGVYPQQGQQPMAPVAGQQPQGQQMPADVAAGNDWNVISGQVQM